MPYETNALIKTFTFITETFYLLSIQQNTAEMYVRLDFEDMFY